MLRRSPRSARRRWLLQSIIGLITLPLYLVIRLGVTSPPWSREAAGDEVVEEPSTLRTGLTRAALHGTGGSR